MSTDLATLLSIARDNGTVAEAITATGGLTLEAAGDNGWVHVIHHRHGVVGARWAILAATSDEQHHELTVQITPTGLERLERAS